MTRISSASARLGWINAWNKHRDFWKTTTATGRTGVREHSLGRTSGGLAILVKNQVQVVVLEVLEVSPWWLFVRVKVKEFFFSVGVVYVRPSLDFAHVLDLLQLAIESVEESVGNEAIIIGGDSNARVGDSDLLPEEVVDNTCLYSNLRNCDEIVNARGEPLLEFMGTNGFVLLNGRTPSDRPAQPTYYSKLGSSVIDLVFVNVENVSEIRDSCIISRAGSSDHFPVRIELWATPEMVVEDNIGVEARPRQSILKWIPEKAEQYQNEIRQSSRILHLHRVQSIESLYENMVEAVKEVSQAIGMSKTVSNGTSGVQARSGCKPWFDKDCKVAKKNLEKGTDECIQDRLALNKRENFVEMRKIYRYLIARKKEEYRDKIKASFADLDRQQLKNLELISAVQVYLLKG